MNIRLQLVWFALLLTAEFVVQQQQFPRPYFERIDGIYYAYWTNALYEWPDARQKCSQSGGDLVTLASTRNADVRKFFNISANATFFPDVAAWIDAACDASNRYCERSTWPSGGFNWAAGYPRDYGTRTSYVAWVYASGELVNTIGRDSLRPQIAVREFACQLNDLNSAARPPYNMSVRFAPCPARTPTPCNNGFCFYNVEGRTESACLCAGNWSGAVCNINDAEPCIPSPCVNGRCTVVTTGNTAYRCDCEPGYFGGNCDRTEEHCGGTPCPPNYICVSLLLNHTCVCNATTGYTGPNCDVDIDECMRGTAQCFGGTVCDNTVGSYRCVSKELIVFQMPVLMQCGN